MSEPGKRVSLGVLHPANPRSFGHSERGRPARSGRPPEVRVRLAGGWSGSLRARLKTVGNRRVRAHGLPEGNRRVRARGLQGWAGEPVGCRPGALTGRVFKLAPDGVAKTTGGPTAFGLSTS